MPIVKAIELGTGQTESPRESEGRCGVWTPALPTASTQSPLERGSIEGDRPVEVSADGDSEYPE